MKIILLLPLFLLPGCANVDSKGQGLVGKWVWYESDGGVAGERITSDNTGEIRTVVFGSDGVVNFYTGEKKTLSSAYVLTSEKTIFAQEPLPVIHVEEIQFVYVYSFPKENELELKENIADGYSHKYINEY